MAVKQDNNVFDRIADLSESYDALYLLAFTESGPSCPVVQLLGSLNGQLRLAVDEMDDSGLLR